MSGSPEPVGTEPAGRDILVDVVVVNWNAGPLLRACLAALDASRDAERLHAIVVDNGSGDGSADGMSMRRAALTVRRNGDNLGFGRACNDGARLGSAPALLFLNPDTAVKPDAVATAARHLLADPRTAIVGARLTDARGRTQRTTARRPTPRALLGQSLGLDRALPRLFPPLFVTEWDHETSRPVDQVMGAFLMIRRDVFERLGGFDERFFVYFEDVDLCTRVAGLGLAIRHLADVVVPHEGQGTTRRVRDRRLFYFLRGRALYVAKHAGRGAALRQLTVDLALHVPLRAAVALLSGAPRDAAASLRGGWMLARDLPDLARRLRR